MHQKNGFITSRGIGAGPADPATARQKFPVHQESPQLIIYVTRPGKTGLMYTKYTCLYYGT